MKITIWPPTESLKIERSQYYILVKWMFKPNKNYHLTPNRKPENWKKSVLYPSKVNVQAKQKLPFDPQQKSWKLKEVSTVS